MDAFLVTQSKVMVWLSGNIVGRINEVTLRRAGLVLRWVTVRGYTPPWVGVMSTGDGYSHHQGRNGEFCIAVGPVTRTVGILTQSVKGAGC